MTRPKYEVERQKEVCRYLNRIYGCKCRLLSGSNSYYAELDATFLAADDSSTLIAWAEVKVRNHRRGDFATIIISAGKYERGISLARITGVPFIFVVEFSDREVCVYEWQEGDRFRVAWGGRKDRDDAAGAEPVVHIPIEKFKSLGIRPMERAAC
jgi:hypothetical protein